MSSSQVIRQSPWSHRGSLSTQQVVQRRWRQRQRQQQRQRQRKHSKAFTGCWTCRARKVKCDESRPTCRQCSGKRLECEGYDIRLQWMAPEMGDGDGDGDGDDGAESGLLQSTTRPNCHRSRVVVEPSLPSLPVHDFNEIMFHLDSLGPGKLGESGGESGMASRYFRCFGVFDSNVGEIEPPFSAQAGQTMPSRHSVHSSIDSTPSLLTSSDVGGIETIESGDHDQPCTGGDSVLQLAPLPVPQHVDGERSLLHTLSLTSDALETDFPLQDSELPVHHLDTQADGAREEEGCSHEWLASSTELLLPHSPAPPHGFSSQERFLMDHYTNRVVHLFGVCDNPKSPWKTIHLPRALQGAGELVFHGSTSEIRNSLRNALLSISAFCLSNDHKTQMRQHDAQKWAAVATSFRGRAIRHLKQAVDPASKARPRYKECLATMLSMVSINVMSGDTESCGVHLDAAHRLIQETRSRKAKYSNKALGLHRIYFYLRTMYQSTLVATTGHNSHHENTATAWVSSDLVTSGGFVTSEDASYVSPTPSLGFSEDKCTYEHIYGIPYSLLVLLNKIVALVNDVIEKRERSGARAVPSHLAPRCDELETKVMEWMATEPTPNTTSFANSISSNASVNVEIMKLMTRAFHNAMIIYFAQHVRLLGHHYLQPFITKVIESIEDIERIKADREIFAAPLYWPAFIAGSEAFDASLQERFRTWYNQVEFYGIEGVRTGVRVLLDVWEQGPCPGLTTTSIWRMVVQRTGAKLLLS